MTGSLSKPSKMPGYGYGLPALSSCKVGSELAKIPGTICSKCYALRGRYIFDNVQQAQHVRLASINNPTWVDDMVKLIRRKKEKYFRWHDSGDLVSLSHLVNICRIAVLLPEFIFWLPTRERKIVNNYRIQFGAFPTNLVIRLSGAMVDGAPPATDLCTSTVHKNEAPVGYVCPSSTQNNKCNSCRACWDITIKNISYKAH